MQQGKKFQDAATELLANTAIENYAIEVQIPGQKTMTEVSNELIYEVLKQVQQRIDRVDHKVDEIKSEMNALRGHQVSMQQDIHNVYGIFGRFDLRLEHIERRLELNDATAS